MASIKEYAITKVATVAGVDMKTAGETTLYSVPAGKKFIPFAVVVRDNSASLAGGTDYDFGAASGASTWLQTVDLSGMTTTTDLRWLLSATNTSYTPIPANTNFVIKVSTGSTLAATATIDIFGYLV